MEEGDTSHEASVATVPPCCAAPSPAPAPVLKRRPYSAARPPAPASVPPSAPAPPPRHTDWPPAHKHNPHQGKINGSTAEKHLSTSQDPSQVIVFHNRDTFLGVWSLMLNNNELCFDLTLSLACSLVASSSLVRASQWRWISSSSLSEVWSFCWQTRSCWPSSCDS